MKYFFQLLLFFTFLTTDIPLNAQYNDPASLDDGVLDLMNIPAAWSLSNGSSDIIVGSMDPYYTDSHTDLVGKTLPILNINNCDDQATDWTHGIMVWGATAAIRNNGNCVAGSGGDTRVMGICGGPSTANVQELIDHGSDIIVVPWTGSGFSRTSLEQWTSEGITFVLSGYSSGHDAWDANGKHTVPGVILSGRTRINGNYWPYGPNETNGLDVFAVTDGQNRLENNEGCATSSGGTSIGAPTIAGVVALMKAANPCLTPGELEEILVATSGAIPPGAPSTTRGGIVNGYEAVLMAQNFEGIDQTWSGIDVQNVAFVSGDLTIAQNSNIEITQSFTTGNDSDVILEAGSTLTISADVEMGDNASFIVKRGARLLFDGATVTTRDCATEWKGIVVEGNIWEEQQTLTDPQMSNKNGIVDIQASTFENAKNVVSMAPRHIAWAVRKYAYGGLVNATGSTFRNNRRVAEFMQYRTNDDKSSFVGCTFDGHDVVASHWNNHGVEYRDCSFTNYEVEALLAYDAAIEVYNNTFDNNLHSEFNQAAINLFQTYTIPNGSIIGSIDEGPNQFLGGYHGVFSEGGSPVSDPIKIENNVFIGGDWATSFYGFSRHDIQHNDFVGPRYGTYLNANGELSSTQRDNQFSSTEVAISVFNDNSGYDFLSNCFDFTNRNDVRMHQGPFRFNIGTANGDAASNNFSSPIRNILFSGADPSLFEYHIVTGTPPTSEKVPTVWQREGNIQSGQYTDVGQTVNNFDADNEINLGCGSTGSSGPVFVDPLVCELPSGDAELALFIEQLEANLAVLLMSIENVPEFSTTWYIVQSQMADIKQCIQKANLVLIGLISKDENYNVLISHYGQESFLYQVFVHGVLLENEEYDLADAFLAIMQNSSGADGQGGNNEESYNELEERLDFVSVQRLNLKRLQNPEYIASPADISQLQMIGQKVYPTSGFARSLYHWFTKDKIELDYIEYDDDKIVVKGRSTHTHKNAIHIAPNPVHDVFTVSHSYDEELDVEIYMMDGKVVKSLSLEQGVTNVSINAENWNAGIYFVTLKNKVNKVLVTEKLVIY